MISTPDRTRAVALIEDALAAFAAECDTDENCAWNSSIGDQDFYGWTGIDPAVDSEYDSSRSWSTGWYFWPCDA